MTPEEQGVYESIAEFGLSDLIKVRVQSTLESLKALPEPKTQDEIDHIAILFKSYVWLRLGLPVAEAFEAIECTEDLPTRVM